MVWFIGAAVMVGNGLTGKFIIAAEEIPHSFFAVAEMLYVPDLV